MLLATRVSKYSVKQSYCCAVVRKFANKHKINETENNTWDKIIQQYGEKLLYNTLIDAHRLRYSYQKTAEISQRAQWKQENLLRAIRTVQPLPLTLKYTDDKSISVPEEAPKNEDGINNHTQNYVGETNFPFNANAEIKNIDINDVSLKESTPLSIETEIAEKKKLIDETNDWMTHYENYENDLWDAENKNETIQDSEDDWKVNYGTPDPNSPVSSQPCGGCGAYLHCKDTAIPGYIPSEIFKNSFKRGGANLQSLLCQRCHFLKEYNVALQVRVSPDDYPNVLKSIPFNLSLAVLMVDLTDFPCSIWPGLSDILGPKTSIVVVGNKVDLLFRDHPDFLKRVKTLLSDNLRLNGFGSSNIKHIELISAKTGYGVEKLITNLQRVWQRKGDVYLIGCANVGKSSLFNSLLQSDYCKIQAADLIQRATTSPWPGTTLNLLKFPVTRFSGYRMYLRHKRLEKLQHLEKEQNKLRNEALKLQNTAQNATLVGLIERSEYHGHIDDNEDFSSSGASNMSGKTKMGIKENDPDFAFGKWCYDTPGVIHADQILDLLTTDELVKTLPSEIIKPETYCIKPGNSLFIAGLARLDYVQGPNSVRLTVFRAKSLPISICNTVDAKAMYDELLGSDLFSVPIMKGDRIQKWPGLDLAKTFKVFGKNVKESSYDVVLSNAGWVAINCGLADYEFSAWTPEKRGVYVREALLPRAVQLRGARIRYSVAYKKSKFI